ncbi:hypothetical protein GCM10023088_39750 [Actinomadura verrucosospora]
MRAAADVDREGAAGPEVGDHRAGVGQEPPQGRGVQAGRSARAERDDGGLHRRADRQAHVPQPAGQRVPAGEGRDVDLRLERDAPVPLAGRGGHAQEAVAVALAQEQLDLADGAAGFEGAGQPERRPRPADLRQ